MKNKLRIIIPLIRNPRFTPPIISWINFLSKQKIHVTILSYYIDRESIIESKYVKIISFNQKEYPKKLYKRMFAKAVSYFKTFSYFTKHIHKYNTIWFGAWDYLFLDQYARMKGFNGKVIYQFHELEFNKFKFCRKADYCVIPEENRLWITFLLGKLKNNPILLPNIPSILPEKNIECPPEIIRIKKLSKRIVLYQGLIDFRKRCLKELIESFMKIADNIHLIIMPVPGTSKEILTKLKTKISQLKLTKRIHILGSQKAPLHLNYIKFVDLGIGLYRPISLNQIYAAPNRLYEFTAFGIPLILPNFPKFTSLSYKYPNAFITVDPESTTSIANGINDLFNNQKDFNIGKINAEKFYGEEGDYDYYGQKLLKILCEKLSIDEPS